MAGNQPLGPGGVLSTSRPVAQTQGSEPAASQPARGSRPAASRAIEAAAPVGQGGPEGGNGFVLTLEDLAPSLSEEFMIYSWQDGDSFPKVAERYFGSRLHVNRLLRNNEGLDDSRLKAGDRILIPVSAPVDAASEGTGASTYTVQSGDVLGTISTTVYGTSRNWRKIYDANRDILADPNQLEVGMVLRIPE